ncbi:hypothetical protein IPC744_16885 [Pseudomonas aeruginosa]|nr:hypothetical protein AO902_29795 [Pseudomonas aeruginosa]RPW65028.1 hypothetical protein IPC744_16885 [Pseudomonas aeruginosa]RQH91856.1 hypothetical protein IPC97_15155 [Pseudomonas aeruginosa]RUB03382.1 hypothetical protein IPC1439_11800 [Pseudomonas aeruginosa]RUJ55655.1 hypothetical protein IPC252_26115 [Pseudomonas aeruginosa]
MSGVLLRPTKVRSAAGKAKLKNLTTPIGNINTAQESQKEIKTSQTKMIRAGVRAPQPSR